MTSTTVYDLPPEAPVTAADFDLGAYDFALPDSAIAQHAVEPRHAARLLVMDRQRGQLTEHTVAELPALLPPGAVLVVNETRVVPARLLARKASGGSVEFLLERPLGGTGDQLTGQPALMRSSKPCKVGQELHIQGPGQATATVREVLGGGRVVIDLAGAESLAALLDQCGHVPLPPYIRGGRDEPSLDRPRYQCTYARTPGAVAAPTAGLHLSQWLLQALDQAGIARCAVTLHVGPGTFLPVRVDDLRGHRVEAERYEVSAETAQFLSAAKRQGRPIVAVGTTTTRVLEHLGQRAVDGELPAGRGETDLTILPGHRFSVVDHMMTNFHLPKSSLLVLVGALAGRERVLAAYAHAVRRGFRFYSYGDANLIL